MSTSVNFAVGEPFPLPILAQTDGGMFQVDKNGMMFLLQLSRTDAIAVEAFVSIASTASSRTAGATRRSPSPS